MAIDTAAKRRSAASILPIIKAGLIPDGAIGASDRTAVAWLYSGISIEGAVTAIHMKQVFDIDLEDLYEMPLRVSFRPLPDELQFKDK